MSKERALTAGHELALLARYRGLRVKLSVDHWTSMIVSLGLVGGTARWRVAAAVHVIPSVSLHCSNQISVNTAQTINQENYGNSTNKY